MLRQLPHVRTPTFFIFAERSNITPPDRRRSFMDIISVGIGGNGGEAAHQSKKHPGLAGLGGKDVSLTGVRHMVPMEAPGAVADECRDWLIQTTPRWTVDEYLYRLQTQGKPAQEQLMVGKD